MAPHIALPWRSLDLTWARLHPEWALVDLPATFVMPDDPHGYGALSGPLDLPPGRWSVRLRVADYTGSNVALLCDSNAQTIYDGPTALGSEPRGPWVWLDVTIRKDRPAHLLLKPDPHSSGGGAMTVHQAQAIQEQGLPFDQFVAYWQDRCRPPA